jgi:DNA-binding transcriptional LysR family regulator
LAGLGVTYLPRDLIDEDIARGELEVALGSYMPTDIWLSAVYAQRRHNSAALRALLDFLQSRLRVA